QGAGQAPLSQTLTPGRLATPLHRHPAQEKQQAASHGAVQQPGIEGEPGAVHERSPVERLESVDVFFRRASAIQGGRLLQSAGAIRSERSRLSTSWSAAPSKTRSRKRAALSSRLKHD